MIFASMNEEGTPAWELVMAGQKKVTRRLKPQPVGAIRAVQPGRTKKGIGKIKILSCQSHTDWEWYATDDLDIYDDAQELEELYRAEAEAEGFLTWGGLIMYLRTHGINIRDTFRIKFQLEEDNINTRKERGDRYDENGEMPPVWGREGEKED